MLCLSLFSFVPFGQDMCTRSVASFHFRGFDQILLDVSLNWLLSKISGEANLLGRSWVNMEPMRRSESSRPSRTFYRRRGCSCCSCSCSSVQQQQKWEVQLPLCSFLYLVALLAHLLLLLLLLPPLTHHAPDHIPTQFTALLHIL